MNYNFYSLFIFFLFHLSMSAYSLSIRSFVSGKVSIPPPITSNVVGTWAYDTMSRRIASEIFPRIIEDNAEELSQPTSPLRSEILLILKDLQSSLECGREGILRGIVDGGPDIEVWERILGEVSSDERNWLDAPWVIAEFYFYRRIMEAFRFFETGYDPFTKQKFSGLIEALPHIEEVSSRLPSLFSQDKNLAAEVAILTSLWGNKMDLSLWPAAKDDTSKSTDIENRNAKSMRDSFGSNLAAANSFILDNDIHEVISKLNEKLTHGEKCDIDIIVDNAGYELVSDLILGHSLLTLGFAKSVTFHTKGHPTFVSDATTFDLYSTINYLKSPSATDGASHQATIALATQLLAHVEAGRIKVEDDLFWCQPTAFWDMPTSVRNKLSNSAMVFVKGDANYRRLLGDRMWALDHDAKEVLSYWTPIPVCALRTCKAEIGCGIPVSEQSRAESLDKRWLVSGKWGVVQLGGC